LLDVDNYHTYGTIDTPNGTTNAPPVTIMSPAPIPYQARETQTSFEGATPNWTAGLVNSY